MRARLFGGEYFRGLHPSLIHIELEEADMKVATRTWLFLGLAALAAPLAGCGGGSSCADARFATVAWSIEDQNFTPLSCQDAGALHVALNFGTFGPYVFPCTAYTGATDTGLPPGNYEFSMQLLDYNGFVLSDTTIFNPPVAYPIYSCAQDDIPDVVFDIVR
jgi:hypothetical protein